MHARIVKDQKGNQRQTKLCTLVEDLKATASSVENKDTKQSSVGKIKMKRIRAIMDIKEVEDQQVIVLPGSVFIVIKLGIMRMNVERRNENRMDRMDSMIKQT